MANLPQASGEEWDAWFSALPVFQRDTLLQTPLMEARLLLGFACCPVAFETLMDAGDVQDLQDVSGVDVETSYFNPRVPLRPRVDNDLRRHQIRLYEDMSDRWQTGKAMELLMAAATGSGKTVNIVLAPFAAKSKKPALIVVPSPVIRDGAELLTLTCRLKPTSASCDTFCFVLTFFDKRTPDHRNRKRSRFFQGEDQEL